MSPSPGSLTIMAHRTQEDSYIHGFITKDIIKDADTQPHEEVQ